MLANKSQSDSVFNLSNFAGGGGEVPFYALNEKRL